MIPGLLPPLGGQAAMLPILQQAWLSRAATSVHNSFVQSMTATGHPHHLAAGGSPYGHLAGFPFPPHPFFLPPGGAAVTPDRINQPTMSEGIKTEGKLRYRREDDVEGSEDGAEDLSFSVKRFRQAAAAAAACNSGEVICPICSIAVRWPDLPEHFEAELRCLDKIRSLSPIVYGGGVQNGATAGRPASNSSQRSAHSVSPPVNNNNNINNKSLSSLSSSSISPTATGIHSSSYLENRWERFERIRNKRRERIGVVRHFNNSNHHQQQLQKIQQQQQQRPRHTVESMVAGGNNSRRRRSLEEEEEEEEMDEDIDIGEEDSISECGSAIIATAAGGASDCDVAAPSTSPPATAAFGPLQYTEADVLRSLSDQSCESPSDKNRDGEEQANGGRLECPSCRRHMDVPVLNIACWHLKCERCWLRAVGTTKACSMCHAAASVRELRKVHV
jgi:hypothetical protein